MPHPPRLVVSEDYEGGLTQAACPLERHLPYMRCRFADLCNPDLVIKELHCRSDRSTTTTKLIAITLACCCCQQKKIDKSSTSPRLTGRTQDTCTHFFQFSESRSYLFIQNLEGGGGDRGGRGGGKEEVEEVAEKEGEEKEEEEKEEEKEV